MVVRLRTDRDLVTQWDGGYGTPYARIQVGEELAARGYEPWDSDGRVVLLPIPPGDFRSPVAARLFRRRRR